MRCPKKKCGEYNPLRCALSEGHPGECTFVVSGQYKAFLRRKRGQLEEIKQRVVKGSERRRDDITWLISEVERLRESLKTAIWSDSEECKMLERENERLRKAMNKYSEDELLNRYLLSQAWLLPEVEEVLRKVDTFFDRFYRKSDKAFRGLPKRQKEVKQLLAKLMADSEVE